jgi:predicted nucleotidyltransferase
MEKQRLDQNTLDDIIQRVVEVAQPQRIILFGSAARGTITRHSDVDLLIVKEGGDADLRARIYENLYGVRVAVDAILVSPADVERYKNSHALVIKPALQEGRVVYEAT